MPKNNKTKRAQSHITLDNSKRKIVLGAAAGTAAAIWHKPLVEAVLLPAHAQTSDPVVSVFFAASATVVPVAKLDSPLDFLIPAAHATVAMTTYEYAASIEQSAPNSDTYAITLFERTLADSANAGEVLYSGNVNASAGGNLSVVDDPCGLNPGALQINIVRISKSEAELSIPNRSVQLIVPAGQGTVPSPMCVDTGLPASFYNPAASAFGDVTKSSWLDAIIPTAMADGPSTGDTIAVLATKMNEEQYRVGMLSIDRTTLREGTLLVDGTTGSLVRVSSTCPEPGKGSSPIDAAIVSVDDMTMVVNVRLGGSMVPVTLPVGEGMLTTETCFPSGSFTYNGAPGKRFAKRSSLGKTLLDIAVPPAHATIDRATAFVTQSVINVFSNGGTSYTVQIALSEAFITGGAGSSEPASVLQATMEVNAPSATPITNVTAGCSSFLEGRLLYNASTGFSIELTAPEVANNTFELVEGSSRILIPTSCNLD